MDFTKEQKEVIAVRGSNVLVSAAAGSGKTAVLVERILKKVTDDKNPVDIDRILVMTFTRAAAAQLKSRLSKALTKIENEARKQRNMALCERLRRQNTLIRGAFICTIDSFCTYILRNNFEKIGLDPSFRMANDADLKLLRDEVMRDMLEEEYENGPESFFDFLDNYSIKKNDKDVEEAIFQLYDYSQSAPYPVEWLKSCPELYSMDSPEELLNNTLLINYFNRAKAVIEDVSKDAALALAMSYEADGPYPYVDAIEADVKALNKVQEIAKNGSYSDIYQAVRGIDFEKLKAVRDQSVNPGKKQQVQDLRKAYKAKFEKLSSTYYLDGIEKMFTDVNQSRASVQELVRLSVLFSERYLEAKLRKKLVDFSDLEHLTLEILYDTDENGNRVPSVSAEALRELFDEIMVDEYQDSNFVQEKIVDAICKKEMGKRNVFLVGDVKQSIYRFRLAKPELFVEKRNSYTLNDVEDKGLLSDGPVADMRIDLHRNFRSRQEVIDTVNAIFEQLMIKEVGGVDYDKDARLTCAADYLTGTPNQPDNNSELLIVCDDGELKTHELEAHAVADRILKLCKEHKVQDGDSFREVRFNDIAVLLRSSDKWDVVFKRILESKGIPAVIESKTGYFDSYEINSILTYLSVINNPRNDEKICEALIGPFGGITNDQLAMVRIAYPEVKYYEALMRYAEVWDDNKITDDEVIGEMIKSGLNTDEPMKNKALQEILQKFFDQIFHYRKLSSYLPVHELISEIMMDTHYEKLIAAMPMGQERLLNITMLLDKATEYEQSSYKGLFHFVQYIEHIRKLEVDSGSAQLQSENDNVVRIMTIHKSKGLEFPICFVSGMGKKHNMKDTTNNLLTDSDYGIGIEYIDSELRVKYPTIVKRAIASKMMVDSLGEELRVLYVALTRAKEKLIMTGTVSPTFVKNKGYTSWDKIRNRNELLLPENLIMEGGSYLEWILLALSRSISCRPLMEILGKEQNILNHNYTNRVPIEISFITAEDLTLEEIDKQSRSLKLRNHYMELYNSVSSNDKIESSFADGFNWEYPHSKIYVPTKVSVSYIKHQAMEENIADRTIFEKSEKEEPVPAFIKGKDAGYTIGSVRGTAYHRIFELLDYSKDLSAEGIKEQIKDFVDRKLMDLVQAKEVKPEDIAAFAASNVGRRMKRAFDNGLLSREQPFCIMRPASEVSSEFPDTEEILIQGIIDVCFTENDEFVIVDYKTDKARNLNELVLKYKAQLDYYAIAIEQITKKRVAEKIIYSVTLNDEISV